MYIICEFERHFNLILRQLRASIFAVQQDTQSFLMCVFIHHVC